MHSVVVEQAEQEVSSSTCAKKVMKVLERGLRQSVNKFLES